MKCLRKWLLITTAVVGISFVPDPASAGPVVGALIANGVGFWSAMTATYGAITTAVLKIGVGLVLSALTKAKMAQLTAQTGIKTSVTLAGADNGEHFVLGRYATAGVFVAPPMSWPVQDRRKRLVYVIDLGPAGQTINRLFINGEPAEMTATVESEFGGTLKRVDGFKQSVLYKILDGSQTAADPYLVRAFGTSEAEQADRDQYGLDPDFPWQADMIGAGRLSMILHFYADRSDPVWSGLPQARFEVDGLPLYDPRKDTTAGGTGAHRWADPATWEQSDNPAVMIYNILRGIDLPDGSVWGGLAEAEDLAFATWAAAMNACDETVTLEDSSTEPRYRAGVEIKADRDEPADIIEQLLAACSGEIAEEGGTWHINVGEPAMPSNFITDDDLMVSDPSEFEPFPGQAQTTNGVAVTHPDPDANWETVDAPRVIDNDLVTEDGRELVEGLALPSCPYPIQAQRLAQAYLQDARRFRVHRMTLPPDAAWLPPLATVSWTSDHNGYDAKVFEVERKQVDLRSFLTQFAVRERDPADYDWSSADQLARDEPPNTVTPPDDYVLTGLTTAGTTVTASDGARKRVGIAVSGIPSDVAQVAYEVRLGSDTGDLVAQGTAEPEAGVITVASGALVPEDDHYIRLKPAADDATGYAWTGWTAVTLPAAPVVRQDIGEGAVSDTESATLAGPTVFDGVSSVLETAELSQETDYVWNVGVTFEYRGDLDPTLDFTQGSLQGRYEEASVWSDWETIETQPTDSNPNYKRGRFGGVYLQDADSVQFRLAETGERGSYRDVVLTAKVVRK